MVILHFIIQKKLETCFVHKADDQTQSILANWRVSPCIRWVNLTPATKCFETKQQHQVQIEQISLGFTATNFELKNNTSHGRRNRTCKLRGMARGSLGGKLANARPGCGLPPAEINAKS